MRGFALRMHGFTLIELIVTLIILGVLAAVSIPQMFDRKTFDALRCYDQAQAAVRYAQKVAIAQKKTSGIFVVITAGSVRVCQDAGCGTSLTDPTTNSAMVITAPSGVNISAAPASTFSFNGLGQPSPAPITVSVTASGEPTRTFTVEQETGYVHP